MSATAASNEGLFTSLVDPETPSASSWSCLCGCGAGADLGGYATTPTSTVSFVTAAQPQSGGDSAATLMAGSKWSSFDASAAKTIVSYSFIDPQSSTFSYGSLSNFSANASAFSDADKQLTREVLAKIAAVCNVQFVEVADNSGECGVLRYGYSKEPNAMNYAGYAFFPSSSAIGGDIWIGANQATSQWDFYRPNLVLHETLHALGLKHPFQGGAVLPTQQDIIPNTVMSYSAVAGGTAGFMEAYPDEPMAYDVAALQQLYGASGLNAGSNWYNLAGADFQEGFRSLWDAGGFDTFDASGLAHGVTLHLAPGAASDIGVRIDANAKVSGNTVATTYGHTLTVANGASIEQAIGTAFDDSITGGDAANRLQGRGGNDALQGGAGRDVAQYEGARALFQVSASGGNATVRDTTGKEGTDSLAGIERIEFADGKIALDIAGNAGQAAKLLGAVFGAAAVDVPQVTGIALGVLDGGTSYLAALDLALDYRLGVNATNSQVVDLLYMNLTVTTPGAALKGELVGMLDSGALSQAGLAAIAADHPLNAQHIDLVGLASSGLAYL